MSSRDLRRSRLTDQEPEIDAEVGDLAGDFQAAQTFRQETINYIRYCLKLSEDDAPRPVPPNQIIAFFKVIGDVACETYDLGKTRRFIPIQESKNSADMSRPSEITLQGIRVLHGDFRGGTASSAQPRAPINRGIHENEDGHKCSQCDNLLQRVGPHVRWGRKGKQAG